MPPNPPVGPYKTVETGDGPAPWYIIPFDKDGRCTGPLTRDHLLASLSERSFTDVFLFSHGWNNDWAAASARYEDFIAKYIRMRSEMRLRYSRAHKPLLVGIFWPSTALVAPWEKAPAFAGDAMQEAQGVNDSFAASWNFAVSELANDLPVDEREEFYALAHSETLNASRAEQLARKLERLAAKHLGASADLGSFVPQANEGLTAEHLLESARQVPHESVRRVPGEFGFATGSPNAAPVAAFNVGDLDPRNLIRLATVRQMKDRADKVGNHGLASLLCEIQSNDSRLRIHLVGHSYGSIVVLSALCSARSGTMVDSVLLLEPAVSQWCFAADVAGKGFPGGYRSALDRTRSPIFSTFTCHDAPLTKFFHLALTRDADLGQPRAAFEPLPAPPSLYAALGGFGPAGLEEGELQVIEMSMPPTRYQIVDGPVPRVCALCGDGVIAGHGDISVPATWWALYQQVERGGME
jgi:hypothetical protein